MCHCWSLTRRDGLTLGFTDHDRDLVFSGITFAARSGLEAAEASAELGFAVGGGAVVGATIGGTFVVGVSVGTVAGVTVASASTLTARDVSGANVDAATSVGKRVAEAALAAGVTKVVFDRGGFLFHGRVKALAEAAREAGLEF